MDYRRSSRYVYYGQSSMHGTEEQDFTDYWLIDPRHPSGVATTQDKEPLYHTASMEVLHRSVGPVLCGGAPPTSSATGMMYPPALQRVFMSPADVYSCYPFEANTPSRTPTPEHPGPRGKQGPPMDFSNQATTLQSVLRGEIPAAYSHLASSSSSSSAQGSSSSSSSSSPSTSSLSISSSQGRPGLSSATPYSSAPVAMPALSLPSSAFSSSSLSSSSMEVDHHHSNRAQPLHHPAPPSLLLHPANTPSPCPSHVSSSHSCYSPRPQSRPLSHESHDSDMQTEPMDLSCKSPMNNTSTNSSSSRSQRLPRKRTAVSAFLDVASSNSRDSTNSPVALSSSLPAKFSPSSRALSAEHLTSSSSSSSSMHSFPPSPGEGQHGGEEFSLLRNLLSVGKHHQNSSSNGLSSSAPNLTCPASPLSRGCDSPASDHSSSSSSSSNGGAASRAPVTGSTRVQLAKKNLLPVTARVTDWLEKAVRFAKSIPEFAALPARDQATLVLSSWARLVLLYMAESNFQFAVTPHYSRSPSPSAAATSPAGSQDEPTMKSVEGVQTFIRKCQQMQVDAREYEFLRMLVLFNAGYPGLSNPSTVDQLNSVVQQLLHQHVRVTRPSDVMHYSRLLMTLPSLFGTNSRMFETLFCKNVRNGATSMEALLREMLETAA